MSSPSTYSTSASSSATCNNRPRLSEPDVGQQQQQQRQPALDLVALPSEVHLRIISFSDFTTQLQLALTCQRVRDEIEIYSKKVYEKIKQEHGVDDTFEERVRDQSNLQTTITRRAKPVPIPYRYRKIVAMAKPLYSIVLGDDFPFDLPGKMFLNPSEDRIAVLFGSVDSRVAIFDLSTKEHLATLTHPEPEHRPTRIHDFFTTIDDVLLLDDNRVVVSCPSELIIWTESEPGGWSSETLLNLDTLGIRDSREILPCSCTPLTCTGHEIACFLRSRDGEGQHQITVLSVNVNDGSQKTLFTVGGFYGGPNLEAAAVSDNKWLVFCVGDYDRTRFFGRHGLYVYSLETNQQCFFLNANDPEYNVFKMRQASDCSNTFYIRSKSGGRAFVLHLDDRGCLCQRFSFPVQERIIKAATKAELFCFCGNYVTIYNSQTGKSSRPPLPPGRNVVVSIPASKKRKELFLTGANRENFERPTYVLNAFCLEEPKYI